MAESNSNPYSEERFRFLTENMADVFWVLDAKTLKFTYLSPSVERLRGFTAEEIMSQTLDQAFTTETRKVFQQEFPKLIAAHLAGQPIDKNQIHEIEQPCKDGSTVWTEASITFIGDAKSGINIIGVSRNINERKKAAAIQRLHDIQMNSLIEINKMRGKPMKEISAHALEACVTISNSQVGFFHFFDEKKGEITLNTWSKNVYNECSVNQDQHYPLEKAGIWADCARERKPIIVNDYPTAPAKKGYPQGHFPVTRFLSIPIFDQEKIVMICGVGNKITPYVQTDIDELQVFLNSVWSILKELQAEEELKTKVDELEKLNSILIGREVKMAELKDEIARLKGETPSI